MASVFPFVGSILPNSEIKTRLRVRVPSSYKANEASFIGQKEKAGAQIDGGPVKEEERKALFEEGSEKLKVRVKRKWVKGVVSEDLEALWDDGYGTNTANDYFKVTEEITKSDGGPPRWFCPMECGQSISNSPHLLFLPGIDGVGLGIIMQHKALGKVFEVQCLHIPIYGRTPFKGLVKFVEETVKFEHSSSPNKPIYLVDSVGGCLALAVASRNPEIDFVLGQVGYAPSNKYLVFAGWSADPSIRKLGIL